MALSLRQRPVTSLARLMLVFTIATHLSASTLGDARGRFARASAARLGMVSS
jgi:hypothetical protein